MPRLSLITLLAACEIARAASPPPPLPEPVTNNVVAVTESAGREYIVSLFGLGPGKTWRDLRSGGYVHQTGTDNWIALPEIPDGRARLAAAAATVGNHVYIFGGYTIAADGNESSVPYVYRLDVADRSYLRLADIPTPVDNSLARVFGHAGAITGGRMLICDGVQVLREDSRHRYAPSSECWLGRIDPTVPTEITWTRVTSHPGLPRYRMAALAHGDRLLFVGGSANPYNYDGIGYDGTQSEPESDVLMFDLRRVCWQIADGPAVMDLRAVAVSSTGIHVIGGMRAAQEVSNTIIAVEPRPKRRTPDAAGEEAP